MTGPSQPSIKPLWNCFQGVIPSLLATAAADGMPNVTYLSQVFYVDERHVALSCQFFNKTRRNLDENPFACCELYEPINMQAWRIRLRFLRSEKEGPVFDRLSARIDAIAAHTGMSGIFRLLAADICEVLEVEKVDGYLVDDGTPDADEQGVTLSGIRTELRGLQLISEQVNRSTDLETLLEAVLETLDDYFSFRHTMILLHDESLGRLVTLASRGYGESGVGAEVRVGEGLIGKAVESSGVLRLAGLDSELRYSRAIRREVIEESGEGGVRP
jgi:adenylate cyclase